MKIITIIGGGLSGTLLTVNLLKSSIDEVAQVKLIDKRGENDLGPAYSTTEDYLLNVPADKMGAVSGEPEHFWGWLQNKKISCDKTDFLPRKLYRKYINELFQNALSNKKSNISYERIKDEAVDINIINNQVQIILAGGKSITADKIVLALGNFTPRNPDLKNKNFTKSPYYVQNPWNSDFINTISNKTTIFFIGTGQTTVDLICGLHRHGYKGKIYAISRHGFLPMTHKLVKPYPSFYDKIRNVKSAAGIFKIIRNEIKTAEKSGFDKRAVIDSLRPYTQQIWMDLETEEKRIFIKHLFRYWEVIRSRIPQESGAIVNRMRSTGQLKIIAGRIKELNLKDNGIEVIYKTRHSELNSFQFADVVVNCIGPELNYNQIQDPLVKNLLKNSLIETDPVRLGINATPDGRILNKDGSPSSTLFTIGLPLRGILWECLAAPEIREQAKNLSEMLLE